MTQEQFQNRVLRANWYDKYVLYLFFLAATLGGLFFLYDVIAHQPKYDKLGTQYLGYLIFIFLTSAGVSGLLFTSSRYKVITIASPLSIDKKHKIVNEIIKEFGDPFCDADNDFYAITYDKNWWTSDYKIYLGYDLTNFYTTVQSTTRGKVGAGIIDFGGTNKVRKKIVNRLTELVNKQ